MAETGETKIGKQKEKTGVEQTNAWLEANLPPYVAPDKENCYAPTQGRRLLAQGKIPPQLPYIVQYFVSTTNAWRKSSQHGSERQCKARSPVRN